jgi:uncharacterized membrane protein
LTSPPEHRRLYIDRARGLAVLIMILAHALDAWTRTADRGTAVFRDLTVVGGFAAPLFLWLAGVALALSGERAALRTGRRIAGVHATVRRGLELFVLAFLFRLQAFVVSPGGPLLALFRVDILNIMGPAVVAAGAIWGVSRGPRRAALLCGALAAAIALAAPVVRSAAWVGQLPVWIQWYLRPAGDLTTFTLFPWAGFVFAGAATGSVLSLAHDPIAERRTATGLAAAGAALVAAGFWTAGLPTIYVSSSFWTTSPTWFAIRAGVLLLILALTFAVTGWPRGPVRLDRTLERFGRRSLFIYWIHVELVYGYATWPMHRKLPVWGCLAAYLLFCGVMYGALQLRDRAALRPAVRGRGRRLDNQALHA